MSLVHSESIGIYTISFPVVKTRGRECKEGQRNYTQVDILDLRTSLKNIVNSEILCDNPKSRKLYIQDLCWSQFRICFR